jgi:DNA-directed RNA polymerase subunit RPC12/RpoP/DNA-binding transcriptional MerR regulator
MRLICLLKALGLTLGSIKGILDSDSPDKVLLLLLDEQAKQIDREIENRQKQLDLIRVIKENIRDTSRISVNSISDIESMMDSKKKLRKTHAIMLILGLIMDAVQIGTLIFGIVKGFWQPFAIGMLFVILLGILMTRMYCKNTDYICAECNTQFKPPLRELLFSKHTPKARKLKCPKCGYTGYCVEIVSE